MPPSFVIFITPFDGRVFFLIDVCVVVVVVFLYSSSLVNGTDGKKM